MPSPTQTLSGLNNLSAPSFVAALGEVFEHAPWVPEATAPGRPYPTVTALHDAMMQALRRATPKRQQAFIAGHPELGSRVKRADLTDHSRSEQRGLELDRLSAEEFDRFSRLNAAYRETFGFPFIVCVRRHASAASILAAFEQRVGNGIDIRLAQRLPQPLIVGEEEELIPDNRSAKLRAELIQAERRDVRVVKGRARVEDLISQVLKRLAVEVVRT